MPHNDDMGDVANSFLTPLMVNKTLHGLAREKQSAGWNEKNYLEGKNIGEMEITTMPLHAHMLTETGIVDFNEPDPSKRNGNAKTDNSYRKTKSTVQ